MTDLKLTIANGPGTRGTYKHDVNRDLFADLAKVRRWRHKPIKAGADIPTLAKRALAHYLEVSDQKGAPVVTDIHVFPAKRSGHSAGFRRHLAALIVGHDPDNPVWVGHWYIWKRNDLRRHFEDRLHHFGFRFVEVNPSDWGMK